MEIVYLSTDEVNLDLAGRWAGPLGADVRTVAPADVPLDGHFDAILYDLDSLTPLVRLQVLAALLAGPTTRPTAVHSYDLDPQWERSLRLRGVVVARRLDPDLIRGLCRLALAEAPQAS
jgi:hypothetical protein